MYFLLAGVVEKFQYLKMGLAVVLTFIGAKMLIVAVGIHIPIWISLVFVATVLLSSVAASLLWPKDAEMDIELDLPEDFHSLVEDNEDLPQESELTAQLTTAQKIDIIEPGNSPRNDSRGARTESVKRP